MSFQHTIYLSGKITEKSAITFYREKVATRLAAAGFKILDPLRGKPSTNIGTAQFEPGEIVMRDLQDVRRSSVMLTVSMKTPGYTSFGTPCEVMFAWENKVPVVFVTDDVALANHYWVRGLCSRVFLIKNFDKEIDGILDHIIHWYGPDTENDILRDVRDPEIAKTKSNS